jgi:hypothetical protein
MRKTLPLGGIPLGLVLAGAAIASVPSGGYTGHFGTHADAKVKFSVKGSAMHNFEAFVPAFCSFDNQFKFVTFAVPKAKIRSGKVKTTYVVRDDKGQPIGKDHLTATFSGGHAKGTLGGSYTGCTIATYKWTAKH